MARLLLLLGLCAIFATIHGQSTSSDTSTATGTNTASTEEQTIRPTKNTTDINSLPPSSKPETTSAGTPSTTTNSKTTTTKPKPNNNAALNSYEVTENNQTCLLVNMTAVFVNQHDEETNVTSVAIVDSEKSSCGKLTVKFGDGNSFTLYFKNDTKKSYYWDEITATVNKENINASNIKFGVTSIKASYRCISGTNISMSNNYTFEATNIQFQAFGLDKGEFGSAQICVADIGNNVIIPIAIGCAVAGLIVIVVIGYMIGRQRVKHRYEAM